MLRQKRVLAQRMVMGLEAGSLPQDEALEMECVHEEQFPEEETTRGNASGHKIVSKEEMWQWWSLPGVVGEA